MSKVTNAELVGSTVSIEWPAEKRWYEAKVTASHSDGTHTVAYTQDGSEFDHDLAKSPFKVKRKARTPVRIGAQSASSFRSKASSKRGGEPKKGDAVWIVWGSQPPERCTLLANAERQLVPCEFNGLWYDPNIVFDPEVDDWSWEKPGASTNSGRGRSASPAASTARLGVRSSLRKAVEESVVSAGSGAVEALNSLDDDDDDEDEEEAPAAPARGPVVVGGGRARSRSPAAAKAKPAKQKQKSSLKGAVAAVDPMVIFGAVVALLGLYFAMAGGAAGGAGVGEAAGEGATGGDE